MSAQPALESGVSLTRYAHASAALADGFPHDEALDLAGIAKGTWPAARVAWLKRIAGPDSKDFADYQRTYAEAEEAFGRSVSPIDSDLAMWLSFLALSEKSANLGELLGTLGLRTSDLSRLSRLWKKRFDSDPKLEPQIAELRKKPLPELRTLMLGKSKAAALPLCDEAAPPSAAAQATVVVASSAPDDIPLDRYAQLRSDIDRGDLLASVLALFRVDEASYARADAFYRAAFETDAVLASDFRVLRAHADKSFRQRSHTSLAAPPREERTSEKPIDVPPPSIPMPPAGLDARIVAPAIQSPAAASVLPQPMARRPAPSTLDMAIPRDKETLPFKTPVPGSKPPAAPAPASGDIFAIAARMKARDEMTGTVEGGIATPKPMPFATKRRPAPATVALTTPVAPSAATPFMSRPVEPQKRAAPPLPGVDPALASRAIPPRRQGQGARALLTLEQHAAMHAELGAGFPLAQVLARYGLDASLREEVDEHYRLSFSRDPRVRAAWDQSYRALTQWMAQRR